MVLSELYKNKILTLAGLLNENEEGIHELKLVTVDGKPAIAFALNKFVVYVFLDMTEPAIPVNNYGNSVNNPVVSELTIGELSNMVTLKK